MNGLPAHLQGVQGSFVPHTYTFPTFLRKIVPFVKQQEARSPYYRAYYVFEHGERHDFLDVTGTIGRVLEILEQTSREEGIPFNELFETATVFGSGRNAMTAKVDPLLAEGYTNIAANAPEDLRARNRQTRRQQQKRWNTFQESKMGQHLPMNILDYGIAPFMFGTRGAPKNVSKTPHVSTRRNQRRRSRKTLRSFGVKRHAP